MSDENDEIDRLANMVDDLLEKLSKYNDFLILSKQQPQIPNIQIEYRDSTFTTSVKLFTTIKRRLGISKTPDPPPEASHKVQMKLYRRYLRRRYVHHFGSFEAFFVAYITKLEQKYTKSLPRSRTRPLPIPATVGRPQAEVIEYFNTYSFNIVKVDAFYWSVGVLMDHLCVRKGGKGFIQGIERMQSRAVDFLRQYDRVMLLAPHGVVRVNLLPLEKRESLQRKRKRKK
ncbi:14330_t:CDS:2 [Ambispora leptoticha]|uniref:14330_t:CDS:1 n=1 Tax=Ambispora leptoticha TaxID=144679 RepID=A0A9N9BA01_9GLOM|nr:14330_t:CDS:2 [Ambispora leptoticha]